AALTKPNSETYEAIANDPDASTRKAYIWIAISASIAAAISVFGNLIFSFLGNAIFDTTSAGAGFGIISLLCAIPFSAIIGVVAISITTGLSNWVAKLLGGTGEFEQLIYTVAAYAAPMAVIGSIISAIPIVQIIGLLIFPFMIYLNVLSVKSVHQLDWGKSALASLLIPMLLACVISICLVSVLALLGPSIGGIFEEIMREMGL
ncbi:MAG: YIP1 family protein, partial [Chloroflexota bacterium]